MRLGLVIFFFWYIGILYPLFVVKKEKGKKRVVALL